MAIRPVFVVSLDNKFCIRKNIEFTFFNGFSDKQKKRCIQSLHQAYLRQYADKKVLEISSKSEDELGVKLSAFNLMITAEDGTKYSVESAFQAGKIFEHGGVWNSFTNTKYSLRNKSNKIRKSNFDERCFC